jgi:hypothetical protein
VILGYGCGVRGVKVQDFPQAGFRPPWPRPEPSAPGLRGSLSVVRKSIYQNVKNLQVSAMRLS